MHDEYDFHLETIIKPDEIGGPARLVLLARAFLAVTTRWTSAIGSWPGPLALGLKAPAQRHGKMDASARKKLGSVFVWKMMEIPAERGKRAPRLPPVIPRELEKERRKHRVSSA